MDKVFFPLRYLALVNAEKRRVELIATLAITALLSGPFLMLVGSNFFHPNGFMDKLLTLTSCLTGFYIAALVAAATFNLSDLDNPIRFGNIYIVRRGHDGKKVQENLTRRQLVCHIFGYLSFLSFFISVLSGYCISMAGSSTASFISFFPEYMHHALTVARMLAIVCVNVIISHLLVVTNIGIYYMMHRIFKAEPKVTTKKPEAAA